MRTTTTLDVDLMPLLERLAGVLESEPNPVRQQQAVELLAVRFALRLRDRSDIEVFVEGFGRHVRQLVEHYLRLIDADSSLASLFNKGR